MCNDVWNTTALRSLTPVLARLATSPEPNTDPVALAREARSAITEVLQHIMLTYQDMGAHSIPTSMQGKLTDVLLAELGEVVEREKAPALARLTDFFRPRAIVASGMKNHGENGRAPAVAHRKVRVKFRYPPPRRLRTIQEHKATCFHLHGALFCSVGLCHIAAYLIFGCSSVGGPLLCLT